MPTHETEIRYQVVVFYYDGTKHTYNNLTEAQKNNLKKLNDRDLSVRKTQVKKMSGGSRGGKERF